MLQVPAKRARTRERGEQRSALLSEKQADGSYQTSGMQKKLYVATRKLKRETAKLEKVQGLGLDGVGIPTKKAQWDVRTGSEQGIAQEAKGGIH
mmetsp:Transcript_11015/g.24424  ORF Transcript_11015/g.24424 Transcript_11015/m.24424 type:complete len:94 (-) Transcript_11015:829-1110(-)